MRREREPQPSRGEHSASSLSLEKLYFHATGRREVFP